MLGVRLLRLLLVTILTTVVAVPLAPPAVATPRAAIALIPRRHSHAARHHARAYRGRHLTGALHIPRSPKPPRPTSLTTAPPAAIAAGGAVVSEVGRGGLGLLGMWSAPVRCRPR